MNLILDFGNTLTKAALFKENNLIELNIFEENLLENIIDFINKNKKINSVIISSVIDYPISVKKYLQKRYNFIELNENTTIPIINKYNTPETLGKDRLAGVVGANSLFPNENILVIDAGTCITYDFINSKNEYCGGSISPGIAMRFKALHNFTGKLPLIEMTNFDKLIGKNTKESILSGVSNGVIAEVNGIIEGYEKQFKKIKIILTGGDNIFFDKKLKNSIFAVPNLILIGLNIILNYNDE